MTWGPIQLRNRSRRVVFTGEASPAPGGGAMPDIAWHGPFECDYTDLDPDYPTADSGSVPINLDVPDGGRLLRWIIHTTQKWLYVDTDFAPPTIGLVIFDKAFPDANYWESFADPGSPDPADWQFADNSPNWANAGFPRPGTFEPTNVGTFVFAELLKLGGQLGIGLGQFAGTGPVSQGHSQAWIEMFTPPS